MYVLINYLSNTGRNETIEVNFCNNFYARWLRRHTFSKIPNRLLILFELCPRLNIDKFLFSNLVTAKKYAKLFQSLSTHPMTSMICSKIQSFVSDDNIFIQILVMLKYLSSGSYRKYYDFLESYKFFSTKFYNISLFMMRDQLKEEFFQQQKTRKHITKLLEIQINKATTPQTRVKALWLIHMFLQLMKTDLIRQMEDQLIGNIDSILKKGSKKKKEDCDKASIKSGKSGFLQKKKNSLGSNVQTEKSSSSSRHNMNFQSVKSLMSIPRLYKFKLKDNGEQIKNQNSQQKVDDELKEPQDLNIRMSIQQSPNKGQDLLRSSCGSGMVNISSPQQKKDISNKDEYFDQNIVIPYAHFLNKFLNYIISSAVGSFKNMDLDECWGLINIYELMLRASDCFVKVIRYFKEPSLFLPVMAAQIFHFDISKTYRKLKTSINQRVQEVQKQFNEILKIQQKSQRIQQLQDLLHHYDIRILKQMFYSLTDINQKLVLLYQNKYVRQILVSRGVRAPNYIQTETGPAQLIYSIIDMYDQETKALVRNKMKLKHKQSLVDVVADEEDDFSLRISQGGGGGSRKFKVKTKNSMYEFEVEQEKEEERKNNKNMGNNSLLMVKSMDDDCKRMNRTRRPSIINEIEKEESDIDIEDVPEDQDSGYIKKIRQDDTLINNPTQDETFINNIPETCEIYVESDNNIQIDF